MTTIVNGLLGGLVSGLLAVVVANAVGRGARPAVLAGRRDERGSRWRAIAADVLYGGVAGGAFVAAELFVLGRLGIPPSLVEALAASLAWCAVLLAVAVLVRRLVLDRRPALAPVVAFHLVYGLAFGGWIRATWIT